MRLWPHAALAALAMVSIAVSRSVSFRFSDGSFSLHAPFWITWPRGIARLLWIWGWLACAALAIGRVGRSRASVLLAFAWMGIALAPYSFLTYSTQIPSRQTYLASAGLAFLVGLALAALRQSSGRKTVAVAALLVLAGNIGYLWTRKYAQYLRRAEPTEQLIRLARETSGPIWVRCFPRTDYIAKEAVHMAAGRDPSILIWTEAEAARRKPAATFCYQER